MDKLSDKYFIPPAELLDGGSVNEFPFPKRIFQTWKTKRVPYDWQASQNAWKKLFPTWKYTLYDDNENREFIKKYFPSDLQMYDNWPDPISRADAVRYYRLFHSGGCYCDLDNKPLKNFESFFYETNCEAYFVAQHMHGVTNALMFSKKGAKIWLEVFAEMRRSAQNEVYKMLPKHWRVMNTTGPMMLSRAVANYQNNPIGMLPVNFNPEPLDEDSNEEDEEINLYPSRERFMEKLRSGSWHSWDSRVVEHVRKNSKFYIILLIVCFLIGLFMLLKWIFKLVFRASKSIVYAFKSNKSKIVEPNNQLKDQMTKFEFMKQSIQRYDGNNDNRYRNRGISTGTYGRI